MPSFVALDVVPQLSLALARTESDGWRRATLKPRSRRALPGRSLPRRILELLIDRVEAAIQAGRIELVENAADVDRASGPAIHTVAYGEILAVLFEEEYVENSDSVTPTATAPKSAARIAAYAERGRAGQPIRSRLDAVPGRDEKLVLAGGINRNGSGVNIAGYAHDEPEEEPVPEELLAEGDRVELERRRAKHRPWAEEVRPVEDPPSPVEELPVPAEREGQADMPGLPTAAVEESADVRTSAEVEPEGGFAGSAAIAGEVPPLT